jgi:hypothetical protein
MRDDASLANEWLHIKSDCEGVSFYRKHQGRILQELQRYVLRGAYEKGSGAALHVRFASAARGLAPDHKPNEIWLSYQEINKDRLFDYYLEVLYFLRIQERILRALTDAFPGVSDPFWIERVRIFGRTVDSLWQHLERMFPRESDRCSRMQLET